MKKLMFISLLVIPFCKAADIPTTWDQAVEVLGVQGDATEDEIKRAYHRLLRQWHPIRNPSPEATERTQQLTAAMRVIRMYPPTGHDIKGDDD